MRRAYLSDRAVPKRATRDIEVVGVPGLTELFARLFA
jgi:hypothetical protein